MLRPRRIRALQAERRDARSARLRQRAWIMNILQAINDRKVFRQFFKGDSWQSWIVFLSALFALPMSDKQLAIYKQHTGRTTPPTTPLHEAWLCIGRRGGKSFILAVIAVFLAVFKDWRPFLGPGEVGVVMVIAADRRQARVIMRYCLGLLKSVPMLSGQIEGTTAEMIGLKNNINIEIHTASFRSTRGYTIIAALLDEIAFWPTDENSAEPDIEVINAIRPGMATVPDAMLLVASSPHARKGALWQSYSKHFGKDGDPVLVWQAVTRTMNPSVPQSFIDEHITDDPARASAEYLAIFRTDIESFVTREAVAACVSDGVYERAPESSISYFAFADPSGGSADSFSLCVGHLDYGRRKVVIDALREHTPPLSPEQTCEEFSEVLKTYRVSSIVGDRYAGQWPVEMFSRYGIYFEQSAKPKTDLYLDLLALLNSQRVELLDNQKLINQLCGLERRVGRGGARGTIDHAPNQRDDLANAIAGLISTTVGPDGSFDPGFSAWQPGFRDRDRLDEPPDPDGARAWQQLRFRAHLWSQGLWF